jgi:hypothetical protein
LFYWNLTLETQPSKITHCAHLAIIAAAIIFSGDSSQAETQLVGVKIHVTLVITHGWGLKIHLRLSKCMVSVGNGLKMWMLVDDVWRRVKEAW